MTQTDKRQFLVLAGERGQRLDDYLVKKVPELSKNKARRLLDSGSVAVNGRRERFANRTLQSGDQITFVLAKENIKTRRMSDFGDPKSFILREDGDLLIVSKPAGIPSQPTKDPNVVDVTQFFAAGRNLWACHRLDKETSGVLIMAKSVAVAEEIMDLFRQRKVEKEYLALSIGKTDRTEWLERNYLSEMNAKKGRVDVVKSGGRPAETRFQVLGQGKGLTFINCFPKTGRTHQIRVHLEKVGLPLLGDKIYGSGITQIPAGLERYAILRHYLHACRISFPWRNGELEISAALPPDMLAVLKECGIRPDPAFMGNLKLQKK